MMTLQDKEKMLSEEKGFQLEEINQWYLKDKNDITVSVIGLGDWSSDILWKTQ